MTRPNFSLTLVALLLCSFGLHAEDIDLFVTQSSAERPNVLFIIDNTANWDKQNNMFESEKNALINTFNSIKVNGTDATINVGIMFASETGSPNEDRHSTNGGGYVRAAIRPMTSANKTLYSAMINTLHKNDDKGNGGRSPLVMAEAYRYFTSGAPLSGDGKVKADYMGNNNNSNWSTAAADANHAIFALPGNALSGWNDTTYNSPIASGCAKNFIIYISNGPNQSNDSTNGKANTALTTAGGSATEIPISPTNSQENPSDEWAKFMRDDPNLRVMTFTIEVNPGTQLAERAWTALMKSMANVSDANANGGGYIAVTTGSGSNGGLDLEKALQGVLANIQAVNDVFASVSLPISVNTQETYLNQVFVGMFRPDSEAKPKWMGNLKQYQMGYADSTKTSLILKDARDLPAISSNGSGFIDACARSFWTPTTANTYWTFRPQGDCGNENSDSPDGQFVEKGAQGFMLRSLAPTGTSTIVVPRTMYTCNASCTAFANFDQNNTSIITPTRLGVTTTAEAQTLIQWQRGLDLKNEDGDTTSPGSTPFTTEMRPSVHGDVLHSRAAAISYGTSGVAVFYGGNDGVFRAINGNMTTGNIGTIAPGGELWSFVPPEFYGNIKRLYDNTKLISYPTVTATDAQPKPYGIDGPLTTYINGSTKYLYAPMRRGGRALYAFDVSSATTPSLKWRIGCPVNLTAASPPDDTGCTNSSGASAEFNGLGQTWSPAKVIKSAGFGSGSAPMLIMGGGYDPCEDADPSTCGSSRKGNHVYVMNANTGALLKTFDTVGGVIAEVAIVPDSNGLAIYGYVADLSGNIYRIDMGADAPGNWKMTQIAALGCATATSSCTAKRKFMFIPDVVSYNGLYTVLVGSGDREKPLIYTASGSVVNSVSNYFFAIQDDPSPGLFGTANTPETSTWLTNESGNCTVAMLCLSSLHPIASRSAPTAADLSAMATKKGWYMSLAATEQVVTSAITIYGTIYFSTHQPYAPDTDPNTCDSGLGTTNLYTVSFGAPSQDFTEMPSIGLPPSPVAGLVQIGNESVPFCIGCDPSSPLQSTLPTAPVGTVPAQPKSRVYWYIQR